MLLHIFFLIKLGTYKYTRLSACILRFREVFRDSYFSWVGVYGNLLGTHWENIVPSIDLTPPTHTTHTTYTYIGASLSVYLGVVKCVCALAEGVHKR